MTLMIQTLKDKSKKYFWILIAIPVLLGAIGWLLPVGNESSSYTAEATLTLGSYNNPDMNDPKRVIVMLTNAPFYKEHLASLWDQKQVELMTNLHVTAVSDNMIDLTYEGESAVEVLNEISNAFLAMDQEKLQQKQKIVQESIDALKNEKVGPDAMVDQQRFLFDLKTEQNDIKPAMVLKSPDNQALNSANQTFNSKERAVLGVLLGVTISFLWLVIPELVRERPY